MNQKVDIKIEKEDKDSGFNCKVTYLYKDKNFEDFVRKEQRVRSLFYNIKSSRLKYLLGINPYYIRIVGYKGNAYYKNLEKFRGETIERTFTTMQTRDNFCIAIQKGMKLYFKYAEGLYERSLPM